jgi:hypothetical protein
MLSMLSMVQRASRLMALCGATSAPRRFRRGEVPERPIRLSAWLLVRVIGGLALLPMAGLLPAQTPLDEEAPWPRVRSTNGNKVTLYVPQVERWTSNWFSARAAVEVKLAGAKKDLLGVVWFDARGSVDFSNRLVTLDRLEISRGRFPEAADSGSNALAAVREVLPSGARTVSLDYLITALGFVQAAARQGPGGLKHTPPEILWATNRTVLVLVDGEPLRRAIPDTALERVVNTPAFLVYDKGSASFYLSGDERWFTAVTLKGPWSLAQQLPGEVAALLPAPTNAPPAARAEPPPRIIVSTTPAELLMTGGLPDFQPIRGTALQYAADTDSQLFFHTTEREAYLLISGRWYKAKSLNGPWNHVAPGDLPADFAKIPSGSPQAIVLASVPGTPQAELAVVANSVPTTATVSRRDARIEIGYDGEPQFKPIEGTQMKYAVNAQQPVILAGGKYYALDNGVWFVAEAPAGPWSVATEVPEEVYTIPPSSPVYYATFARVYQATDEEVEVGYTAGYQGAYEDEGTVVYGTGYDYEPWEGDEYYGWGWTWGYNYAYVPWYQWWVWRPWWNPPGGLRAAVIENIYDRWQGRNGITHYDGGAIRAAIPQGSGVFGGHPALYGRHWPSAPSAPSARSALSAGSAASSASAASARSATSARSALSAPQAPPANALALNPYARPESAIRAGEIPRGAQALSSVRQAPGSGRDLYASPDGGIYQRRNEGWYRKQAGGGWSFYAPTQGTIDRTAAARGAQQVGAGTLYRPTAAQGQGTARTGMAANRVPNAGGEARAQEVAALERQYYARSVAQMRAQNARASGNFSRPARPARSRR